MLVKHVLFSPSFRSLSGLSGICGGGDHQTPTPTPDAPAGDCSLDPTLSGAQQPPGKKQKIAAGDIIARDPPHINTHTDAGGGARNMPHRPSSSANVAPRPPPQHPDPSLLMMAEGEDKPFSPDRVSANISAGSGSPARTSIVCGSEDSCDPFRPRRSSVTSGPESPGIIKLNSKCDDIIIMFISSIYLN